MEEKREEEVEEEEEQGGRKDYLILMDAKTRERELKTKDFFEETRVGKFFEGS